MPTSLFTPTEPYRKALSTNSTASAFAAKVDSLSMPTGAGYVAVGQFNSLLLKPYGTDADNETGSVRVYGVKAVEGGGATSYTHVLLGEWDFVLDASLTGVSGGAVGASEYYADTITRVVGREDVSDQIISGGDGETPAHILFDCKGHSLLFIELIVGTAASVNA